MGFVVMVAGHTSEGRRKRNLSAASNRSGATGLLQVRLNPACPQTQALSLPMPPTHFISDVRKES